MSPAGRRVTAAPCSHCSSGNEPPEQDAGSKRSPGSAMGGDGQSQQSWQCSRVSLGAAQPRALSPLPCGWPRLRCPPAAPAAAGTCLSHRVCVLCSSSLPFRTPLISYSSRTPSLPGCIFGSAPPPFLDSLLFHPFLAPCLVPLSFTPFPAMELSCSVHFPGLLSPCSPAAVPSGTLCCCLASCWNLFALTPLKASYATGQHKLCITQITVSPNLY